MEDTYQLRVSLPKYSLNWNISILLAKYRELLPNDLLDLKALTHLKQQHC